MPNLRFKPLFIILLIAVGISYSTIWVNQKLESIKFNEITNMVQAKVIRAESEAIAIANLFENLNAENLLLKTSEKSQFDLDSNDLVFQVRLVDRNGDEQLKRNAFRFISLTNVSNRPYWNEIKDTKKGNWSYSQLTPNWETDSVSGEVIQTSTRTWRLVFASSKDILNIPDPLLIVNVNFDYFEKSFIETYPNVKLEQPNSKLTTTALEFTESIYPSISQESRTPIFQLYYSTNQWYTGINAFVWSFMGIVFYLWAYAPFKKRLE
jgi:hypothetical protein